MERIDSKVITLMYHDVVEAAAHEASGFSWPDAALYKLDPDHFNRHLAAITGICPPPTLIFDLLPNTPSRSSSSWMITFDDGGISSYTLIADRLEAMGWRGHFFITTDYIGAPSFMSRAQICDLHRRGHAIGSHSCTHPLRMANCGWQQIVREWNVSVNVLSDLLGRQVELASIPGGQYSREVAEAASQAGIKVLFTSEPTTRRDSINGCLILGRYSIQRKTAPQTAAAIANGKFGPRACQTLLWQSKKMIKELGGQYYLKLRESLLAR